MYPRLAVLAGGLILLCTVPLAAQDAVLSQMYGSGVHAFFSGDYGQAYERLTAAADGGTADPRCYYFRGLTFLQLGREEEAKLDFEQAAQLEAEDINKFYNVSRALERIQGSTRLAVEQYRVKARMEGMQREEERRKERYGKIRAEEKRVLDAQAEAAPATPPDVPAAPQPASITDPFGLGATPATSVGPDDVPAKPAEPAPPVAEPAEAPAAPAQEDPFAVPAPGMEEAPAATPPAGDAAPAEVPADTSASGVFGAMQKAVSKAVGGEEAGEAAPGMPAAEEAEAADDPFAQPPAEGPSKPAAPAPEEPAAAAPEMPAAEEKPEAPAPAQPAPADDPFAEPAAAAPEKPAAEEKPEAPAPEMPAAEEKPAVPAPEQPAPADDPFAEPAAAAPEKPAAEEKPEAGAAEPAVPAPEQPADENPFMEEKAEGEKEAEAAPADDDPFAEKPAKE